MFLWCGKVTSAPECNLRHPSLPAGSHIFMPHTHAHAHTQLFQGTETIHITEKPTSHRGCREKPEFISRGEESQLSNKASSMCIHRHGYCLQWASPC